MIVGVRELLRAAHRPLTTEEVLSRVDDKNRNSAFNELRQLRNSKEILKIELRFGLGDTDISVPLVTYRWIGDKQD